MKANKTQREQALLALMPAVVLLMLYAVFVFGSRQKELKLARRQLDAAQTRIVSKQDLMTAKVQLQVAQKQQRDASHELQTRKGEIARACQMFDQGDQRFASIEKLVRLFANRDISLLGQSKDDKPRLSTYQRAVFKLIAEQNGQKSVSFRNYRFHARYTEAYRLLTSISEHEGIIPVSLEFDTETKNTDGAPLWKLVVAL